MRTQTLPALSAIAVAALATSACDSNADDSAKGAVPFCESITDGDSYFVEEGGASGESGQVFGRLITNVSEQIHDPLYVASVDYTIKNTDIGGTQTQGKTNQDGEFSHVLGKGNWLFKHSSEKNGYTCANEFEFVVVGGDTTQVCIDANCL